MYFLEACRGVGLCAEALKYIPAGCNVSGSLVILQIYDPKVFGPEMTFVHINLYQVEGDIVNVIETKGSQVPQVKKGKTFLN